MRWTWCFNVEVAGNLRILWFLRFCTISTVQLRLHGWKIANCISAHFIQNKKSTVQQIHSEISFIETKNIPMSVITIAHCSGDGKHFLKWKILHQIVDFLYRVEFNLLTVLSEVPVRTCSPRCAPKQYSISIHTSHQHFNLIYDREGKMRRVNCKQFLLRRKISLLYFIFSSSQMKK